MLADMMVSPRVTSGVKMHNRLLYTTLANSTNSEVNPKISMSPPNPPRLPHLVIRSVTVAGNLVALSERNSVHGAQVAPKTVRVVPRRRGPFTTTSYGTKQMTLRTWERTSLSTT